MIVTGIDFETTGLDPAIDRITEIGLIRFDVVTKTMVACESVLVQQSVPLTKEIQEITGLNSQIINDHGVDEHDAAMRCFAMIDGAEYVVAHNADFERGFLASLFRRHEMPDRFIKWIDTRDDIEYPERWSRSLTTLAAEHGFLNPFPHRALFDVATMLRILSGYPFGDIAKRAESPSVKIHAVVSFDDREKAKKERFQWDASTKTWFKTVKAIDIDRLKSKYPFPIVEAP